MRARTLAATPLLFGFLLLVTASCSLRSNKLGACKPFEGGKNGAVWSECPDKVKREVKCEYFVESLKCDCFEDGAEKWFFNAKDPPLANREDATRVANANCHWGLELP